MDTPPPPPLAELFALARKSTRTRAAALAAAAGISRTRYSQLEAGWERKQGQWKRSRAKPENIASIALALSIAPERLEAITRDYPPDDKERASITEAVTILREMLAARAATPDGTRAADPLAAARHGDDSDQPGLPPFPAPDDPREGMDRPWADRIWMRLNDLAATRGIRAEDATGEQVFGSGPPASEEWINAAVWDGLGGYPVKMRVWIMADVLRHAAERDPGARRNAI